MSVLGWVLIVAGGWLLLALIVVLVVGRVIRNRDRQEPPQPTDDEILQRLPTQRQAEGDLPGS